MPGVVNKKKGALDSQPQVIKLTSCLPMVVVAPPGTPASSTTKTGRHDIAEILLKVALNTINQIKSIFTLDWWLVYINNCSLFQNHIRIREYSPLYYWN